MTNLNRLKTELSNKAYFDDATYTAYLGENNLVATGEYAKATMQRDLLQTVYDILSSLANNIDLFRSVETEFTTTGEAYKYLQSRLQDIEKRILSIGDNATKRSAFSFLFMD